MPKNPDPKLIMERNRLLEEVEKLKEELRKNDEEIRSRGEKLSELASELEELRNKHTTTSTELTNALAKVNSLEEQLETTLKEKETLTENLNNLTSSYKAISETAQSYSDSKEKISELEAQATNLEQKNRELNEKIFSLTQDKDSLLKEKLEFMESAMNEKMELRSTLTKLEHELQKQKEKVKELRQKKRDSEEGLLGSTMQIEQLKKEIDTKARQIEDMRSDGGVVNYESGVIGDMASLIDYLKICINNISRSLRLVVPDIEFLIQNGIVDILKSYSKKLILNIAVPLNEQLNHPVIEDLQHLGVKITNTSEQNLFALNIDGAKIALGVIWGAKARVLFTDIPELVSLLTEPLMKPFVKGTKI